MNLWDRLKMNSVYITQTSDCFFFMNNSVVWATSLLLQRTRGFPREQSSRFTVEPVPSGLRGTWLHHLIISLSVVVRIILIVNVANCYVSEPTTIRSARTCSVCGRRTAPNFSSPPRTRNTSTNGSIKSHSMPPSLRLNNYLVTIPTR